MTLQWLHGALTHQNTNEHPKIEFEALYTFCLSKGRLLTNLHLKTESRCVTLSIQCHATAITVMETDIWVPLGTVWVSVFPPHLRWVLLFYFIFSSVLVYDTLSVCRSCPVFLFSVLTLTALQSERWHIADRQKFSLLAVLDVSTRLFNNLW